LDFFYSGSFGFSLCLLYAKAIFLKPSSWYIQYLNFFVLAYDLPCTLDLEGNTEGKIRANEELDKLKEQRAEEQVLYIAEFLLPCNNSLQIRGHTFISFFCYIIPGKDVT
jgi:hypothetical protein